MGDWNCFSRIGGEAGAGSTLGVSALYRRGLMAVTVRFLRAVLRLTLALQDDLRRIFDPLAVTMVTVL